MRPSRFPVSLTLFLCLFMSLSARAMGERPSTTDLPGTVTVTEATFEREVIDARGPVLVFFTADWCPYCQRTAPNIGTIAADFGRNLKVVTINYDRNPRLVKGMDVKGVPSLFIIRDGKAVARSSGYQNADRLRQFVLNNMSARP